MPIFQDNRDLLQRLNWLRIFFVVIFICLFVQLWFLSVLEFEHYEYLAERNRIRTLPQIAPRGLIYDRENRVLVDNVYGFNLLLFRDELRDLDGTIQVLVEGLDLTEEALRERLQEAYGKACRKPRRAGHGYGVRQGYPLGRQSSGQRGVG